MCRGMPRKLLLQRHHCPARAVMTFNRFYIQSGLPNAPRTFTIRKLQYMKLSFLGEPPLKYYFKIPKGGGLYCRVHVMSKENIRIPIVIRIRVLHGRRC